MTSKAHRALDDVEAELFATARAKLPTAVEGPLFILGAPRTGSTILYQTIVAGFNLPYFSNLTNSHFARRPIIGLSLQAAWPPDDVTSTSAYGKIAGPMQPSEASEVMKRWFGGGHPSEIVSSEPLTDTSPHIQETIAAAFALFGKPLVIKNAWNCFRISALARLLPNSAFVWIRRDIAASACSDLEARYATKGDSNAWNSATPRNVDELRKLPYWEQVTENQFEFARAVSETCALLERDRTAQIWYEDFCADPAAALEKLRSELAALRQCSLGKIVEVRQGDPRSRLSEGDCRKIEDYVHAQGERLAPHRWFGPASRVPRGATTSQPPTGTRS